LTISDDGLGFEEKNGGDSKRHGLGLVKRLAQQVGGKVEHRSDPGTTWTVKFPVAEEQELETAL